MSLLGGKRQTILLNSGRPEGRKVEADVTGAYAVHPQVTFQAPSGGETGWAITHVSSGYLVWKVRQHADALVIAQWLEEHSPLPPDQGADELLAWVEERRKTAAAELGQDLQNIAPKWDGNIGDYVGRQ